MFQLIIVIVTIALVVVLALASTYYAGEAFNKGAAAAKATEQINQGTQILGAMDLFQVDHRRYPDSIEELVAGNYLQQVPRLTTSNGTQAPGQVLASAHAAEGSLWLIPKPGVPVAWAPVASGETPATICRKVNDKARKYDGILKRMQADPQPQCFGPSTGSLKVVVARTAFAIEEVFTERGEFDPRNKPPSDPSDPDWLQAPRPGVSGGGASSTGGGSNPDTTPVTPPGSGGETLPGSGPNPTPGVSSALTASVAALEFGDVLRGQTSAAQTFLLMNAGEAQVNSLSISSSQQFPLTTDCPTSLPAGGECRVSVRFSPSVAESIRTGAVYIYSGATEKARVTLRGTSRSPVLTWNDDVNYGTVPVGSSVTRTFTLTNTGSIAAQSLALSGSTYSGAFQLTGGSCVGLTSLAPGESCTQDATLTPPSGGTRGGVISAAATLADTRSVGWSAFTPTQQMTVNGDARVNTSYNFGTVTAGSRASRSFTVSAGSEAAVTGLYVTMPLGHPLTLTSNTCGTASSRVTLNASQSCNFTIQYGDSTSSVMSGAAVVVTSNADNSPKTISLSGKTVLPAAEGVMELYGTTVGYTAPSDGARALPTPSLTDSSFTYRGALYPYDGFSAYGNAATANRNDSYPLVAIGGSRYINANATVMRLQDLSTSTPLSVLTLSNFVVASIAFDSSTGVYYALGRPSAGVPSAAVMRFRIVNNTITDVATAGDANDGRPSILPTLPAVLHPDGWIYFARSGYVHRINGITGAYEQVPSLNPPSGYWITSNDFYAEGAGLAFDRQGNAMRLFNSQVLLYPYLGNGQFGTPTALVGVFNSTGTRVGTGSNALVPGVAAFRQGLNGTGLLITPGKVYRIR